MFTVLDQIRAYLQANTTYKGVIKLSGTLEGTTSSSVSIRPIPSYVQERYLQGRNDGISFQILVKMPNEVEAMKLTSELADLCDGLTGADIPNLVSCHIYTTPNFVEKTPNQEYIYQTMLIAEVKK